MAREVIYLHDVEPRPRYMYSWERFKHREVHWLVEMFAEMIGVFLYVYAGLGPTAALIIGNLTAQTGIGSLYTIGFAYAIGIILAITLCATTSGGHFSPGVTITLSLFRGFPKAKAVRYIIAQILGSFLTCLVVYVQWKDLLVAGEEVLKEKGLYDTLMFTNTGPAGVFALYVSPGTNLHRVLLNEFVTDFMLGLAICGVMDTTNHFIPPVVAPWIIGLTYATAIWGYAPTAIALNTARDVGGRMMALAIWGKQASGGPYAAIAALTNIPATILAFAVYDLFLGSANRTLSPYHIDFLRAQLQYQQDNGLPPQVHPEALKPREKSSSFGGAERPIGDMEVPEEPLRAENHA
ncbi:aquaporin-like protein [Pisolithus marmoratus]|nr:aquaporin-like protein [Pisolithus marmoratus]